MSPGDAVISVRKGKIIEFVKGEVKPKPAEGISFLRRVYYVDCRF